MAVSVGKVSNQQDTAAPIRFRDGRDTRDSGGFIKERPFVL